jgi:mannose-6-phosphate isomerase-like protein (cupin superfamily)
MPATKDTIRIGTEEATVMVASSETDGAIFAMEVAMPPGGGPPMMHRHRPAEIYRVDRGELTLYVENPEGTAERILAGPGEVVLIPANRSHTIRNESDAEAKAFAIFAPGDAIEGFFRAAGELASTGAPAMEEVLALAEGNGIEFVGPIPESATGDR